MGPLLAIFITVFLAELGDKTQLATLLFAAEGRASPVGTFIAAGGALLTSTAVAVIIGSSANHWLAALPLKLMAGTGFVLIGLWMIAGHYKLI